ncbi:MAG: beta-lactamase family protein [Planctomycetes bacterium]|nr:beta-lactamase family protein [Planctomycetota bacterium]
MSIKLKRIMAALILFMVCPNLHAEEKALKDLYERIQNQCKEHQVPGMALVIVKEDKVLLSEVFGFTDRKKTTPITEDTVFSIGSSSKPLTSTLIALLVSQGKMKWDDPVTKYLPEFDLKIKSDNKNDYVTIRDLLAHRTGFFHMELIQKAINWEQNPDYTPPYTRETLLKEAAGFEPIDRFREKHNYSNIGMLAAAVASGKACGADWDTVMEERMFKPLGMTGSSTLCRWIGKDQTVAKGHLADEDGIKETLFINMDVISPAGGINSTLGDMTKWMKMLLCNGRFENKRLIDEEALRETWKTQIKGADLGGMMPGADYGLGWFVKKWKGYAYVEHGGNALGYSALVALIPELHIGFVMLSNLLPNPMQFTLSEEVWEALVPADG